MTLLKRMIFLLLVLALVICAATAVANTLYIPANATTIHQEAFMNDNSFYSLVIPEGVRRIESKAFAGCDNCYCIYLPASLEYIAEDAFDYNNPQLAVMYRYYIIPGTYTESWCESNNKCWFAQDFEVGKFRYEYISPHEVMVTDWEEPEESEPATTLTIPQSVKGLTVTGIGEYCFQEREKLSGIILPDSITSIEEGAFSGCTALESIRLPTGLTSLPKNGFQGCSSLKSITIPAGVTVIPENCFFGCDSLALPDFPDGLTQIQKGAFSDCFSLKGDLVFPETCTVIDDVAFHNCTGLTGCVHFSDNTTKVGASAFYKANISGQVELKRQDCTIGNSAFAETKVTSALIWSENIPDSAFRSCSDLEFIWLYKAKTIGNSAFAYCRKLESVNDSGHNNNSLTNVIEIGEGAFIDCPIKGILAMQGLSMKKIGYLAFECCDQIDYLSLGGDALVIEDSAFWGCTGLRTLLFGFNNSVASIGSKAFYGTTKLSTVKVPVETILADDAFEGSSATIVRAR